MQYWNVSSGDSRSRCGRPARKQASNWPDIAYSVQRSVSACSSSVSHESSAAWSSTIRWTAAVASSHHRLNSNTPPSLLPIDPPRGRAHARVVEQRPRVPTELCDRLRLHAGLQQMVDGGNRAPGIEKPVRGSRVQFRLAPGMQCAQTMLEEAREQAVIAVFIAFAVERKQEQVRPFEMVEHRSAVVPARDRVTQRGGQLRQDAGLDQERATRFALLAEDVFGEIDGELCVRAGKRRDETAVVGALPQ